MKDILVAFSGEKTREYMTELFAETDISVSAACGTGAEILAAIRARKCPVVLCGYQLYDMEADELYEQLPKGTVMVLLAEEQELECCQALGIMGLKVPASREAVVESVEAAFQTALEKPPVPKRSEEDKQLIARAKEQLMEERQLSEEEAYRLIQRTSMNVGAKMVDTAKKILDGTLSV